MHFIKSRRSSTLALALALAFGLSFSQFLCASESCVKVSEAKYSAAHADLTPFYTSGGAKTVRVIIGYRNDKTGLHISSALPGRIIHEYKLLNSVAAEIPSNSLQKLIADPNIRLLEIDGKVQLSDAPNPEAPLSSEPDLNSSQTIPVGIMRTHAPEVWAQTSGKSIKVAVLDTGIDKSHPDISDRVIGGQNFSSSEREAWNDGQGHGTHVAGTIAAENNNIGVVGMAPQASLIAVKVLDDFGSGSYSDVIAGVEYAIGIKADVANMSLGGTSDNQTFHDVLVKAHANGLFVAAAAGNSGEDGGNPLNFPGAYPEVVAVAAVDDNDQRAYFSSYNKYVALAGPGVNVLSLDRGGIRYTRHSGTSMATPHVSGAAALVKSAFPADTLINLKRRIVCSSEDLFPATRNQWTGHGLLNVKQALSQNISENCHYLLGDVTEPVLTEPESLPEPSDETPVTFVKKMRMKLINDGEKKQILVTVKFTDQSGSPRSNLKVTTEILERDTGPLGKASAMTNRKGEAQFILKGFNCGRYIAHVKTTSASDFSDKYGEPFATLDLGSN